MNYWRKTQGYQGKNMESFSLELLAPSLVFNFGLQCGTTEYDIVLFLGCFLKLKDLKRSN